MTNLAFNGVAAALRKARADALEEAAQLMEARTYRRRKIYAAQNSLSIAVCEDAAAIRAIKDKQP